MRNTYLQQCDLSSCFRTLKGDKISLVASALIASVTFLQAAPIGGVVTSGTASIVSSGSVTNITQTTQKAAINWQDFSIGTTETVNFNQPNISSVTLNRVVGNEKSVIDGALNANGQVFILNSNGVLFSKNASINTAGLVATTMNLSDTDFMNGNYAFKGDSAASIINQGTITISDKGYAALFGKELINEGIIKATLGKINLTGASEVTLNLNGNSLVNLTVNKGVLDALVENKGAIYADGGEVYLTTNAVNELLRGVVNNTGIAEAQTLDDIMGKIELFAHGGTTNIGGILDASAPNGGDGGFIETSGKKLRFLDNYFVTTLSKYGKTGTWLLDPSEIYIVNGGSDGIGGTYMDADDVTTALATNNLTLTADDTIYIQEALNITQHTLTLVADTISPEAPVTVSGTAGLVVKVAQSRTVAGWISNGDDDITPGGFIYNHDDDDVIAAPLSVGTNAHYSYYFGSDGTEQTLTGVFNNGKLRIGNGWYNSVAHTNGMLEQPWYYDNVTNGRDGWFKLTYNTYHLDQVVAIGGDGTNIWNLNGDIIHTDHDTSDYFRMMDKITNISVDTSGVSNGTGTITSTLTFVSDNFGQFKLINAYVLAPNVNFIKTTTSIKNESGMDASNIRVWIGTRDDYIAENDSNYKTKGNIGANGFESITVQTDEAKAIIITEDTFASGNGAAVLFYSTTTNTNTIIEDCCSISNVIDLNPLNSIMNLDGSGAEDGSYGIFLSLGSLANQQTKNLVWYYAAGPVSQLNDVVAQVGQSSGASSPTPPAQALTPIITPFVNNTAVQPPVLPKPVTLPTSPQQFISGGQAIQLMSTPSSDIPTDIVTMADIRQMQSTNSDPSSQGNAGSVGNTDIRVPLGQNSLIQLLNGGVNLPTGIEQEFFMARN